MPLITSEIRYRLLKYVAEHPDASQREVARALGVSLGKANYCLKALVEKGLVKIRNFARSGNKSGYAYILTRRGIRERTSVAHEFLRMKIAEYDALIAEIRRLRDEVQQLPEDTKLSAGRE